MYPSPYQTRRSLGDTGYIYGAYSCGNSSIITIESTISDDSDYRSVSPRSSRIMCSSDENVGVIIRPGQTAYRSQAEGIYDSAESVVRRSAKPAPAVLTTNMVGQFDGQRQPVHEVSVPAGQGEVPLPTQVHRAPVLERKNGSFYIITRRETSM